MVDLHLINYPLNVGHNCPTGHPTR